MKKKLIYLLFPFVLLILSLILIFSIQNNIFKTADDCPIGEKPLPKEFLDFYYNHLEEIKAGKLI